MFWKRSGCSATWRTAGASCCRSSWPGSRSWTANWRAPEFRQLKQRIALRCTLRGFDAQEAAAYIYSRMARAGLAEQTIFSPELISEIHFRSQGIPRLINAICDNLLLTAFAMESKVADLEMLDEVTADMRLDYPREQPFTSDPAYPQRVFRSHRP